MNWVEKIEDFIWWAVLGAISAVVSGVWWLIRQVFTNQQQLDVLKHAIAERDQRREEDREALAEVKDGVKRIESVLMKGNGHD